MSARRGPNQILAVFYSSVTAIGDVIILGGIDNIKPHCFVGVQFFGDSDGATEAIPTMGTVDIKIQSLNNAPRYEDPPLPQISAADPSTITWAANTMKVKATPTGIDIATHYRLVVTCNET